MVFFLIFIAVIACSIPVIKWIRSYKESVYDWEVAYEESARSERYDHGANAMIREIMDSGPEIRGEKALKSKIDKLKDALRQYGDTWDGSGRAYCTECIKNLQDELDGLISQRVVTEKDEAFMTVRQRFIAEERRKMTSSLRYDVLRRDGFRCQLCGATASDGVLLHVDHIVPVSKGGKTEMSNLRTLCERCNLGKSDKTEA